MCFIVQLIEHSPEIVLFGRRSKGMHVLHSSVDRAFTRDLSCLDEEVREGMCFIVQLIEHSPVIVLIGRRRQGRHVLHSSVDRAFTRDCLDWTMETGQTCPS